jgi:hypothetical protein
VSAGAIQIAARQPLWASIRRGVGWLAFDGRLVGAFLASRLIVLVAAVVAETLIPRNPALTSGDPAPILRSLTSWDGIYYLGIARDGYHATALADGHFDVAFQPLYPFLVRVLAAPWPAFTGLVAVALSNVLALVGLGLLARLGEPYLGRRRARLAAAYLAIFPFAAVFSMAYTESLFLVLTVSAFLAAERRRFALAGILLALDTLTRLQAAVLVVPIAVLLWQRSERRLTAPLAWLLLAPTAAAAFLLFASVAGGNGSGYFDAMATWGRTGLGSAQGGDALLDRLDPYRLALAGVFLVSLFSLVYMRVDRVPVAYALVPVLTIALVLASGLLESVGRYVMLAFPFVWILARRGPATRFTWPLLSAALLATVSILEFGGYYVP